MDAMRLLKEDEFLPGVHQSEIKALINKWNVRGLLDDITNTYKKGVTAILLENTARGLRQMSESAGHSTASSDVAIASRYVFPLVRRVWPGLVANDIFAVQPMTMPVGAVAYFKIKYGTDKGSIQKGDEAPIIHDRTYSSEFIDGELLGEGDGTQTLFEEAFKFLPIVPKFVTVYVTVGGKLKTLLDKNGDGKLYDGSTLAGQLHYESGDLQFEPSYTPDKYSEVLADYRYNMEMNSNIPEIDLEVTFDEIKPFTRKLKAKWSPEAIEDMKALYAIDTEEEIVRSASAAIQLEMDQEFIMDVFKSVPVEEYFEWDRKPDSGVADIFHIQSLVHKLSQASNFIHRRTFRAPANWIMVSSDIGSLLQCIPQFTGADVAPGDLTPQTGIMKIGRLAGRWDVYQNPLLGSAYCIVGYKGTVFYDTGFVYAPYIPLQATPTFYNPSDFSMVKGLRTRYNKKLVRREYYAVVKVLHL